MVKDVLKRFSTLALAALMVLTMLPVMAMAATTTLDVGVDGLIAEADPDVWKFNSGTLEGEVVPTGGCGSTAQTSTLTFVNNKGITAVLAFEYELLITGDGSVTVGGVAISGKGIFSQEFASGEKMDVTITSAESGDDNSTKAIIRNIKLYDPDVNVTVTFAPATTGGSYTVDGNAITSIESKTNTARYDYKLVATANSDDYKFLGWYNNTSKSYFSVDAEVTTNFISDCEITAKFAPKSAAIFDVNGQRFADLGEAVEYAEANNQTLIVLVADGVISGEYTIPSGITLLIPFDDANTLYTNEPGYTTTSSTPSAYRVLSMLSGSSITVDGAISIGGKHYTSSTQYCCYPTGAYGQIIMDSGSTIVLNNGANLYAWGYITGAGIITAKSGANVYEYFQVTDWRGGSYTGNMKDNEQKVFPFSQYYVQNIESELVLYAGANEYAYISVTASIVGTKSATIPFVGEGALFSLDDDGVFVKKYIPSADRMEFKVSGGASLNSIALSVANVSVDSKDYVLPINSNVDIIVESGKTTLAKDVALLPGVTVEVGQDAELIVAEGASVYVYGLTEWNSKYVYTGKNSGFIPVRYSPSGVGSRGLADAMVNINGVLTINGEIYTTASGANICSSLGTGKVIQVSSPGAGTITYQNSQADSEYIGIPITPAKLRNADGTYFETATVKTGTTVNYYKDGGIWHVHTAVPVPPKDATCTEKGNTAGTKCSVCNTILSGVEEIPANGHQWDKGSITTAPTCTEDGVKTFTCLVCDATKTEKVEKKGHISAEAVRENEIKSTCTVKGSYDEVVYCKECGKELSRVTKTIDALGHTPGEAKRENVVEPSCMVDGRYEEVVYCSVCNDEISRVNKTIDATGHTPVEVPEVPATCTKPGTAAGTKCDVCGEELSGFEAIPPAGHQWDDGVVTTEPTCEGTGVKTFTCSNCQEKRYEDIPATGHQWDEGKVTTEPKCEEAGVKTYTCKVCNETKTEAIDAMGHTPVEVPEVPATCTEPGKKAGTKCSVCDTILSGVEEIPAKGHQWNDGEITTAPTCTEKGVKTYTCSVCKETKTEKIDKTNDHTPGEAQRENVKEATCTKDGSYDEVVRCKVCNKELSREPKTITSPGHQWDDGVVTTEPKCEEAGVKTYTCKVCKETKTEAIDATGHTPVEVPEVPATCTEPGKKAGTKCSVCNKILSGVEEIPAKGHTPGKAVKESVVLATCEAAGSYEEVVYCEVCKEKLTRVSKTLPAMGHTRGAAVRENVIDSTCADEGSCDEVVYCEVCKKELSREAKVIEKKAHTPVDVAEVPATCTEPGTTAGTKCDVCGTILSGVKEIPANGHTEVIRNAKPATDTEDGYTGDVYCEVCNELLRNGEVIPATHVKITWIINGVKHETVCAKGEIPVYDGETPAKPETSRFTYEFKGWDKEIVAATENAEYTAEFTAIGKNGLCIEGNDTFWIKNGVNIAFPGLIRIADENGHIHYYYFAEDGKAVKNGNYKVNKNNGLPLPEYGFAFDSDGVIVHDEDTSKNGICDGDGSKFYYIDGVKVGEGLIKVGDYYYYARTSSGEIVRNRQYWITKTNELPIQQGIFDFDAEGRMIVTGFIHAFGATYYYDNGVLAKGFTKIGDDYYIFNASSGKMYSNAMMWVPDNEYGITGGMYEFDADGKMIRTGFITTGGYTYYYDNGVLAKGFTKIGDDYYFFNAGSGKMYRDATLWVADNAEYGFVGGMYYFGADGKMVLPDIENGKKSIVTINGKKYLTIDGAYAPTGLYEIDGNCYYVKAAGELAVGETVWVDNKNGLIPAKGDWRAFDAEGKLIHTGFVTGGDGYVYHYTDDVLSLGFTCIDGEYYLFNAGSGKMYRDANMWVGPNDYGIVGGMYYFDANGKMAR